MENKLSKICLWKSKGIRNGPAPLHAVAVRGCAYRAGFLPKLHGHRRSQPLSADGPSAGAAVQGQGDRDTHLGTQVTPVFSPGRQADSEAQQCCCPSRHITDGARGDTGTEPLTGHNARIRGSTELRLQYADLSQPFLKFLKALLSFKSPHRRRIC